MDLRLQLQEKRVTSMFFSRNLQFSLNFAGLSGSGDLISCLLSCKEFNLK